MNKKFRFLAIALSCTVLIFGCRIFKHTQSQNESEAKFNLVCGVVTDNDSNKLVGVTVYAKHAKTGVVTDIHGSFRIFCQNSDSLTLTATNYKPVIASLNKLPGQINKQEIKIRLTYKNITNVSSQSTSAVPINSFPFPPIVGYTQFPIKFDLLKHPKKLSQTADILEHALHANGYDELSYFNIERGFALLTRIEMINSDGTSIYNSERFSINEKASMDLKDMISPRAGVFRLFGFIVTDVSFQPQLGETDFKKLNALTRLGYNVLPNDGPTNDNYTCTVVVYEFAADKPNVPLKLRDARLNAKVHLEKSKILSLLY